MTTMTLSFSGVKSESWMWISFAIVSETVTKLFSLLKNKILSSSSFPDIETGRHTTVTISRHHHPAANKFRSELAYLRVWDPLAADDCTAVPCSWLNPCELNSTLPRCRHLAGHHRLKNFCRREESPNAEHQSIGLQVHYMQHALRSTLLFDLDNTH